MGEGEHGGADHGRRRRGEPFSQRHHQEPPEDGLLQERGEDPGDPHQDGGAAELEQGECRLNQPRKRRGAGEFGLSILPGGGGADQRQQLHQSVRLKQRRTMRKTKGPMRKKEEEGQGAHISLGILPAEEGGGGSRQSYGGHRAAEADARPQKPAVPQPEGLPQV